MTTFQKNFLKDRVAFVTGGGTGICKGIAMAMASYGAKVAIVSRKIENLEATAKEIEALGTKALAVSADVRNIEQVEAALRQTAEYFGGIDIIVNGAAGNFLAPVLQLSANGFKTVIDIDLLGTFNVCKSAYPYLEKSKHANIINISATLHHGGTPMQSHVAAAKAGVDALTSNLAVEWGPSGIRVNGIAPGAIDSTEGIKRLLPPEIRQKMIQRTPLQRMGKIEDIADTALFLVSDAASFIQGSTLVVDGGRSLNRVMFEMEGG